MTYFSTGYLAMIYEIGIFKNQNLIVFQQYYALKNIKDTLNKAERVGLINLIMELSIHVLDQKITSFSNKSYQIFFTTTNTGTRKPLEPLNFFIYAITDLSSDGNIVNPLLKQLNKQFYSQFPDIDDDSVMDTSIYDPFKEKINLILGDERLSPIDRVKTSLFKGTMPSK
jgi:hypothetical protein